MIGKIDYIGRCLGSQQGGVGPRDGAVLDGDAASGRAAQENQLRVEHPGVSGGPPWLERDTDEGRPAGGGQQVGVARRRTRHVPLDLGLEQLDAVPGDLEPMPWPEPAGGPLGTAETGPRPSVQVDGVDATGIEVEVDVLVAGGLRRRS